MSELDRLLGPPKGRPKKQGSELDRALGDPGRQQRIDESSRRFLGTTESEVRDYVDRPEDDPGYGFDLPQRRQEFVRPGGIYADHPLSRLRQFAELELDKAFWGFNSDISPDKDSPIGNYLGPAGLSPASRDVARKAAGVGVDATIRSVEGVLNAASAAVTSALTDLGAIKPQDRIRFQTKVRLGLDIVDLYLLGAGSARRIGKAVRRDELHKAIQSAIKNEKPKGRLRAGSRVERPSNLNMSFEAKASRQNLVKLNPDEIPAATRKHEIIYGDRNLYGTTYRHVDTPRGNAYRAVYAPDQHVTFTVRRMAGDSNTADAMVRFMTGRDIGIEDYTGRIRTDTRPLTEGQRLTMDQLMRSNRSMVEARTDRIALEESVRLGNKMGMDPEKMMARWEALRKIDAAPDASTISAFNKSLDDTLLQIMDIRRRQKAGTATDVEKARFLELLRSYHDAQKIVEGSQAEIGRALRMMQRDAQALNRLDPATVKDILRRGDDPDGAIQRIGKALDEANSDISRHNLLSRILRGTSDVLSEVWINSLLSGPSTHAVNIVGNTVFSVVRAIEGTIVAALPGTKLHLLDEIASRAFALKMASIDAVRLAARAFATEEVSDLFSKIDTPNPRAIPSFNLVKGHDTGTSFLGGRLTTKALKLPKWAGVSIGGKQIRLPGRALMAADEFFKTIFYRTELNALAYRAAREAGINPLWRRGQDFAEFHRKYMENPPDADIKAAMLEARRGTFTNAPDAWFADITRNLNKAGFAGRIFMPFQRTPYNLLKEALKRTPFALIPMAWQRVGGKARKMSPAEKRAQEVRAAMGIFTAWGVSELAEAGYITGAGPVDPKEWRLWYAAGNRPYSIRFGDTWVSYERLDPISSVIAMAADYHQIKNYVGSDRENKDVAGAIIGAFANNMINKTYLSGLSQAVEMIHNPTRYSSQWWQRLVASFVPNILGQVARTEDTTIYEARGLMDAIRARVPKNIRRALGDDKDLVPKVDMWGQDKSRDDTISGAGAMGLFRTSQVNNDKVVLEMIRVGYYPHMPPKKILGTELTESQYREYVQLARVKLKQHLDRIVNSDAWNDIPLLQKETIFRTLFRRYADIAATIMKARYPELVKKDISKKVEKLRRK